MHLAEITLALFSLCNVLRVCSYLPQIMRVAKDRGGAQSISYTTWGTWIGANASTAAYAAINIADWLLFAMSMINMLGCATVVILTMWKRRHWGIGRRHHGIGS